MQLNILFLFNRYNYDHLIHILSITFAVLSLSDLSRFPGYNLSLQNDDSKGRRTFGMDNVIRFVAFHGYPWESLNTLAPFHPQKHCTSVCGLIGRERSLLRQSKNPTKAIDPSLPFGSFLSTQRCFSTSPRSKHRVANLENFHFEMEIFVQRIEDCRRFEPRRLGLNYRVILRSMGKPNA